MKNPLTFKLTLPAALLFAGGVLLFWLGRLSVSQQALGVSARPVIATTSRAYQESKAASAKAMAAVETKSADELRSANKAEILSTDRLLEEIARVPCILNRRAKRQRFEALLASVTPENAESVFRALGKAQDSGAHVTSDIWDGIWAHWAEVDGAGAMRFLLTRDAPGSDSDPATVGEAFARKDRAGMQQWLAANRTEFGESALFLRAEAAYLAAEANGDLAGATAKFTANCAAEEPRRRFFEQFCDDAVQSGGVDGLKSYFESVPDEAKATAFNATLWRLRLADPEAAKAWFTANASKPWREDGVVAGFVGALSASDPAGTAEWAATLPPPPRTAWPDQDPLQQSLRNWARTDAEGAARWILAHPDAPWSEAAINTVKPYVERAQRQGR
jgi:hypothetical protein